MAGCTLRPTRSCRSCGLRRTAGSPAISARAHSPENLVAEGVCAHPAGELVDGHEADVVAVRGVFPARVAQADDEEHGGGQAGPTRGRGLTSSSRPWRGRRLGRSRRLAPEQPRQPRLAAGRRQPPAAPERAGSRTAAPAAAPRSAGLRSPPRRPSRARRRRRRSARRGGGRCTPSGSLIWLALSDSFMSSSVTSTSMLDRDPLREGADGDAAEDLLEDAAERRGPWPCRCR